PFGEVLREQMQSADMYLYFGHGSGSIYYRKMAATANGSATGLEYTFLRPASLVMGCSSGRVCAEGPMEAQFGTSFRFLINGAPCYVGNLWDVTDRDIDTFADHLLARWCKQWRPTSKKVTSLTRCVAMARDACKLKWLIGSAPVVYGLP